MHFLLPEGTGQNPNLKGQSGQLALLRQKLEWNRACHMWPRHPAALPGSGLVAGAQTSVEGVLQVAGWLSASILTI